MSDSALQGFIEGLASRVRPDLIGPSTRLDERIYGWRNVPTPVAFRQRARPVLLGLQPATSENIRKINLELFVGLFRYKHIIKRMREWVRDKVGRMRHVKWAETEYAPPRSIRGGRHGGRGYREARAEFSYNQGNNRITRQQRRRYGDPYLSAIRRARFQYY